MDLSTYAAFTDATEQPRFSEWLRLCSEPLWTQMITHRFTRDLANDALPAEVFRRYLVYEHAFVDTAVTIFGYALVRAPSIVEQRRLVEILRGLTGAQNDYFERTFDALGVAEEWRHSPLLPSAVCAFRDGMLGTAAHGSYEDILAAMLGAEWMYFTWSEAAQREQPKNLLAAEWIALHVAPPFAAQVAWLRSQLDQLGPWLAPFRQARAAAAFRRTLELEIDFHDVPYAAAASV